VDQLSAFLPSDSIPWWKQRHLLRPNPIIFFCDLLLIGQWFWWLLDALDQWKTFTQHPAGASLGWINAIYWLGCGVVYTTASWIANRYER
jgi:hypothetical protein